MTTDALTRDPSALPLAAGGATRGSAAAPLPARLAQLFRPRGVLGGVHSGVPHPLLPLLRVYHDQATPAVQAHRPATPTTACPVATAALAPTAPPAALPDIGTLTQRITALPPLPEAMTAVLLA